MALSSEQQWTLIACGMIAHADDVLEVGEWDEIVRLVNAKLDDDESDHWLGMLTDRGRLEEEFAGLTPPDDGAESILHAAWRMALADGHGSEIEAAVHDRIAERLGVDTDRVATLREEWSARAANRAELVVAFAAAIAHIDGQLDSTEAVQFDALLGKQPVSVARRLQLAELLYSPPTVEALGAKLAEYDDDEREAVLYDLAPMVLASHRGDKERAFYFDLARRANVSEDRARALLES